MSDYQPSPDSLAADVCTWLRNNPHCLEVTIQQIVQLFPHKAKTSNVNPCLATPVTHRLLDRVRNAKGELVYRRGRAFDGPVAKVQPPAPVAAPRPEPAAPPAPAAPAASWIPLRPPEGKLIPAPAPEPAARKASPLTGGAVKRLPELDVSNLQVHSSIPVPVTPPRPGQSRYDQVFNKLDAVGHCLFLPREYLAAIKQAAKKYSKRTGRHVMAYAIPEQPDKCGVWRLAPPPDKGTQSAQRSSQ